ncbi:predicted protein [Lichtheimia corymbifera JMRC:FSU:9682]|uniref:Uncharacterized protein n=1 Tax=Lichtheimia corymbifera JMRC:FSU:9682 TaxID=1263082 RepID=A0A068SDI0_9FUNG|nr:predicted protein [Lichtheimia corymbifera JMRC:FSU:9682]
MKAFFVGSILIAVAIINNVSAIEFLDDVTYNKYEDNCSKTPVEKCHTVGYCDIEYGKNIIDSYRILYTNNPFGFPFT